MSEVPGQQPMFTEAAPGAAVSAVEAPEGSRTPRQPGWTLLGGPGVSERLWHRVAWLSYDGAAHAVCGVAGRPLDDAEHEIICCPACSA